MTGVVVRGSDVFFRCPSYSPAFNWWFIRTPINLKCIQRLQILRSYRLGMLQATTFTFRLDTFKCDRSNTARFIRALIRRIFFKFWSSQRYLALCQSDSYVIQKTICSLFDRIVCDTLSLLWITRTRAQMSLDLEKVVVNTRT